MNQNLMFDSTKTTTQMETTDQQDTDITYPFLGLGYHSTAAPTRTAVAAVSTTTPSSSSSSCNTSGCTDDRGCVGTTTGSTNVSVVEQILQQCLQYHHDQEIIRNEQLQQQQGGTPINFQTNVGGNVVTKDAPLIPNQIDFVRASRVAPNNCDDNNSNNRSTTTIESSQPPQQQQQSQQQGFSSSQSCHKDSSIIDDDCPSQQQQQQQEQQLLEVRMKESKVRAQALIERFHQQQQQLLLSQKQQPQFSTGQEHNMDQTISDEMTIMNPADSLSHTTIGTVPDPSMLLEDPDDSSLQLVPSILFAEQRRIGFERETERKRLAHVRNLQYMQQLDDKRLLMMEEKIQQTKEYEMMMKQQYEQKRIERKERIQQQHNISSYGGIGTKERKGIVKHQTKDYNTKQGTTTNQNNNNNNTKETVTVALYVSGLGFLTNRNNSDHQDPNNEFDSDEEEEKEMKLHMDSFRQLFASYGAIQKIHFYQEYQTDKQQRSSCRTKNTSSRRSKYKGDCLVIYNCCKKNKEEDNNNNTIVGVVDDEKNPEHLLRIVCEQVR